MNLINYEYLKNKIVKALANLKDNVVLHQTDNLRETKSFEKNFKDYLINAVNKVLVIELIQQAYLLTRKAANNPQISDLIAKELNLVIPDQILIDEFGMLLAMASQIAGQEAVDTISVNLTYKVGNVKGFSARIVSLIPQINKTTADFISRKIEEAKDNMLTPEEGLQFTIDETINNLVKRSEMIVKNEIANVVGATTHDVYQNSGVTQLKWVTSLDERVCPICSPLDGKIVNINGTYVGGEGAQAKYPPIHINCRCFVVPEERNGVQVWTGQ